MDLKKKTNQSITKIDKMLEEHAADQLQKLQKLKKIIEIVNFLPPNEFTPHWLEMFSEHPDLFHLNDLFKDSGRLSWYEEAILKDSGFSPYKDYLERSAIESNAAIPIFTKYPKLKNYIFSSFDIKKAYADFWFWRAFLPKFAMDTTGYAHFRDEVGEREFLCSHSAMFFRVESRVSLKIKNNTLLPNAPSVEFLFGLKNIDRLRGCQICKRVFWANRKDAWGCSPQHSNLIRVRRARKNAEQRQEEWLNSDDRKNHRNKSFLKKDGEK